MSYSWYLRLPFAATFFYHGAGKLLAPSFSSEQLDLPLPLVLLAGLAEVLIALGVLAGGTRHRLAPLLNRFSAIGAIPILIVAIAMHHWPKWSFVASAAHPLGGMEFQLLLLGVAVYLMQDGRA